MRPDLSEIKRHRQSDQDLAAIRRVARIMDDALRVPGTRIRFGLDALIGLIPGLGDVAAGTATTYIILAAQRMGASNGVIMRMVGNVLIDTALGSIPFLGDLFDVAYRANRRNVQLLERYLESPRATGRASNAVVALAIALVGLILAAGLVVTFLLVRWLWQALF